MEIERRWLFFRCLRVALGKVSGKDLGRKKRFLDNK